MAERLVDLDELVLRCRDDRARSYIAEAADCYRAGAFRAGIVATWIAVAYDIIDKLQELALTGDKQAEQELGNFEQVRRNADITGALKFERDLLSLAKDKFELLSPVEYLDLSRLQEDRNRCAHPSMVGAGEIYTPSAELARLHLRNAVSYLLQRQPVQGKAAMDRILAEVNSPYFPTNTAEALKHFQHGPLLRPRKSLVHNLALMWLKSLLLDGVDYPERVRLVAAFDALRHMHREIVEALLSERLSDLVRRVEHDRLSAVITVISTLSDLWEFLDGDLQSVLRRYVASMPEVDISHIETALKINALRDVAVDRVKRMSEGEFEDIVPFLLNPVLWDRLICLYLESRSFDTANRRVRWLIAGADELNAEQVRTLIQGAVENDQVEHSFEFKALIHAVQKKSKAISKPELDDLLKANGLEQFCSASDNA